MSKLERVALRNAGHIKQPLTLDEILDEIESDDYSTDLMLQHLLLYIAGKNRTMNDYSENLLKIQEAGRKLPELMMRDKNTALLFLAQTIVSAQKMIEYLNEPANE